ncbi:MAG TPA: hypothetical protein P5079_11590, partial [Elusimicrobiota bacterium]|nr:hypothetical protein [Elusimicrobiota bacterium]
MPRIKSLFLTLGTGLFLSVGFSGAAFAVPQAVTDLVAYESGQSNKIRLVWTTPQADVLQANSTYYIQYTTMTPGATTWAYTNAQVLISTSGVAVGTTVSFLITPPMNAQYSFHIWAANSNDPGNVSPMDTTASTATAFNSPFNLSVVGSGTEDWGMYGSLAIDKFNYLHIAHLRNSYYDFYYSKWMGSWSSMQAEPTYNTGYYTSIAIDPLGSPCVVHQDGNNYDLFFSSYNGSVWSNTNIESSGNTGYYASLAWMAVGGPLISYVDYSNSHLKVAYQGGSGIWETEVVSTGSFAGTSVGLDGAQVPHIAYVDSANADLKYATWAGSWSTTTVDADRVQGGAGYNDVSLVFDGNGNAHMAYRANNESGFSMLKYARWTGTGWSTAAVDGGALNCQAGYYPSITLD